MLTAEEVKSDKKARAELVERVRAGAQFTCFTSAKVQILTQNLAETALVCGALMMEGIADMCGVTNWRLLGEGGEDPGFCSSKVHILTNCIVSTKVQILTHLVGVGLSLSSNLSTKTAASRSRS